MQTLTASVFFACLNARKGNLFMVQNVVFVLTLVIAVGAGVVTAVSEVGRPRSKGDTKDMAASEMKTKEGSH